MSQAWRVGVATVFMAYNLSGVVGKGARRAYYAAHGPSERLIAIAVVLAFLTYARLNTRRDHESLHGERCVGLDDV